MKGLYNDHRKYFADQEWDNEYIKKIFELQGDKIIEYRYDGIKSDKVYSILMNCIREKAVPTKNIKYDEGRVFRRKNSITSDLDETTGLVLEYISKYIGEGPDYSCNGHGCEHFTKSVYDIYYKQYAFPIYLYYIKEVLDGFFYSDSYKEISYYDGYLNKIIQSLSDPSIDKPKDDALKILKNIKFSPAFRIYNELEEVCPGEYQDCSSNPRKIYFEKREVLEKVRFETIKDLLYFAYDLFGTSRIYTNIIQNKIMKYLGSEIDYDKISINNIESCGDEFLTELLREIKKEANYFELYKEIQQYTEELKSPNIALQRTKQIKKQ